MSNRNRRRLSTTVYLNDEQKKKLLELSLATGFPQASIVRIGIDLALAIDHTSLKVLCIEDLEVTAWNMRPGSIHGDEP